MNIPIEVLNIADDIKYMRIRGAGKIARSAAEALKIAALKYSGPPDPELFKKYILKTAELLISTRPTAVSLPNAVLYVITSLSKSSNDFSELRNSVVENANRFIENSLKAIEKISEYGAKRIIEDSVVLTHCHSTAAVSIIIRAYEMGKIRKVYSTETRPLFQGRITAKQLLEKNIPVIQIPDSAVRYIMHDVDQVIIGADTIASNGAVVNKIGTSQIALVAHESRVRVFVASETYKFSPTTLFGELVSIEYRNPDEIIPIELINKLRNVKVLNPVFDVTPPEYIDAIITEVGVIPPQATIVLLTELLGWALDKVKLGRLDKLLYEELVEE
uniref:Ribose 1,5-bisphosphate isomerase n=1 Tax=Staphylothermus marinus TaxID=2280 RepID=A0A7C4HCD8_STAMA